MRTATVLIKSTLAGKVRQVARITGPLTSICDSIRLYAPQVPTKEVINALKESSWQEEPVWFGNHSLAVQVLNLSPANAEFQKHPTHLDD